MASRLSVYPATGAVLVSLAGGDVSFDPTLRGISIGTAGDLKVDTMEDNAVVIPGNCLAIGVQHSIYIKKIYQTGTTATQLVGWR